MGKAMMMISPLKGTGGKWEFRRRGEEGFGVEIHLEAQFDTKGISTKNLFILHSRPFKDSPKTS